LDSHDALVFTPNRVAVLFLGIWGHLFYRGCGFDVAPEKRMDGMVVVWPLAPRNRLTFGGQSQYIIAVPFVSFGYFLYKVTT
jgi:hypothetical protein